MGLLILTDALFTNTPTGIKISLYAENSTVMLVHNIGFFNAKDAIVDTVASNTLIAGGNELFINN